MCFVCEFFVYRYLVGVVVLSLDVRFLILKYFGDNVIIVWKDIDLLLKDDWLGIYFFLIFVND